MNEWEKMLFSEISDYEFIHGLTEVILMGNDGDIQRFKIDTDKDDVEMITK